MKKIYSKLLDTSVRQKFSRSKISQNKSLEVLNTVPVFKYTDNLERQIFIQEIYPYFDLFMLIPFVVTNACNNYNYEGVDDIYVIVGDDDNEIEYLGTYNVSSKINDSGISRPGCSLFGGCVYELLYKKYGNNIKYNNVDLHKYCDATGDIDIKLFFPNLQINDKIKERNPVISFFNRENKINSFFKHFTHWIFDLVVDIFTHNEIIQNEEQLKYMFPNTVDFDIYEYDQIDEAVKNDDYGFRFRKVGNFYVVGYYETSMFKTQIICKVVKDGLSVIDHLLEFVCSNYFNLPNGYKKQSDEKFSQQLSNSGNNLLNNNYSGNFETQIRNLLITPISFSNLKEKYKQDIYIQTYTKLIDGNISGYKERYTSISNPDDPKWRGKKYRHKGLNHVARIFYLFEFFYQNEKILDEALINEQSALNIRQRSENFLLNILQLSNKELYGTMILNLELINWFKKNSILYYYKIINGNFNIIKVSFKTFFLAYLNILSMRATNSGNVQVNTYTKRPYNDTFCRLIDFLKNKDVEFIPSDIYSLQVPKLIPGRRIDPRMKTITMDVIKLDRYHQVFIDKLFDDRHTFNLQSENPNMTVSKIQTFWRKNKSRKEHKLFKNDSLLSRYTASNAIKDVLNNLDKLASDKILQTQKREQQENFDRSIHEINTKRTLEMENRRKDYFAAKKIQKLFKTYKNRKTKKEVKSFVRNSINTALSNVHSKKRRSSAAKKIQRKFRSFTKRNKYNLKK